MTSNTLPLSTFMGAFNDPSPTSPSTVASHQQFLSHLDSQTSSLVHNHHHEHQPPSCQSVSPPAQAHDPNETDLERQRRISAEEDKRRRNTAASARFRIKKKLRDQEMERRAREQADRVNELEKKISQLELENKWLRNLLVEKKS
ncbi:hypothetical protein EX30DRAFT_55712 [Ascodesmis nigricans]|uniref:BZIP domain-containing protein n=1 Tax=Ascodesmis nigricans TaxID=341454 RepID=A0A4S2MUV5_9PEZI|nr:hypothetical protein EX30DRAFT_55712 [Ascodesmis nigricans]